METIYFWLGVVFVIYMIFDVIVWFAVGPIRYTLPLWYNVLPGSGMTAYFIKRELNRKLKGLK